MNARITYGQGLFSATSADTTLKINNIDLLFHAKIKNAMKTEGKEDLVSLIKNTNIDLIIKIAHVDKEFETFCRNNPSLQQHWEELWCAYGFVLSADKGYSDDFVLLYP